MQIDVRAMQPGNPGSAAQGSSTLRLFPPGSDGYAANRAVYDQLRRYLRVEGYLSHDGASLGKLYVAGVITAIRKTHGPNSIFELEVAPDYQLANMSRPFPGEFLSNDVTSAMLKSYLGTNELGASDDFNPYTSANYTSTSAPGTSSGTWTGTTDDGMSVVTCSTGSAAALLSKTGAMSGDRWHTHYVEVTGRLTGSNDTANAGRFGIGISQSNADLNTSIQGYATAAKLAGRYILNCQIVAYSGGTQTFAPSASGVLTNVDDPNGNIPLTVGLLVTTGGNSNGTATATLTINGRIVLTSRANYDPGTVTQYPFLRFGTPASGSATVFMTNLTHMVRVTTDGPSTAAAFGNGSITTSTNSLGYGVDPGPNFLETWSRLATREGWYWRYTPQPYTIGSRTLGTVDFAADPGTDHAADKSIVFDSGDGNLVELGYTDNDDPLATDTAMNGQATPDGGGVAYWRDINSMVTYGVIQDETLGATHSDFNTQRKAAANIVSNKTSVDSAGSKTATVLRDANTADKWRELDKVMIHDPEMGANYLSARVVGYTFDEGQGQQRLTLDQFSEE